MFNSPRKKMSFRKGQFLRLNVGEYTPSYVHAMYVGRAEDDRHVVYNFSLSRRVIVEEFQLSPSSL